MFKLGGELIDTALTLVHASEAAYQDDPTQYDRWDKLGLEQVRSFPTEEFTADKHLGSTSGFVASNTDHLVISFRGSDDVFDLAVNLTASQDDSHESYQGGVHQGFMTAIEGVWIELHTLINSLYLPRHTVWVTGHSLGGALATLTAKRLSTFMDDVHCITFGQPRVGDPTFFQNYQVQHHRYVNEHDVIPKLPPRGLFTRYWHVGNEELLDAAGNLASGEGDTSLLEDLFFGRLARSFDLSSSQNEGFLDQLIKTGLEDHAIRTYVSRLMALAITS